MSSSELQEVRPEEFVGNLRKIVAIQARACGGLRDDSLVITYGLPDGGFSRVILSPERQRELLGSAR